MCSNIRRKKKKLSKRFSGKNNNFAKPEIIAKITKIKLQRYGRLAVNNIPNPNPEKAKQTLMKKYGVSCGYFVNCSPTSKLQKQYFNIIKTIYPDAILEYYIK